MDSDSPANACIAGQPTIDLGTFFTPGNTRKRFTWTGRTPNGPDSARRVCGHRGSPASRRSPPGQGYRP